MLPDDVTGGQYKSALRAPRHGNTGIDPAQTLFMDLIIIFGAVLLSIVVVVGLLRTRRGARTNENLIPSATVMRSRRGSGPPADR
jgi:hypothetical protein